MDVNYINILAESYIIENELYKNEKIKSNELSTHFYNLIKDLRANQPYLYEVIENSNKFEQQSLFNIYFDLTFKPEKFKSNLIDEDLEYEDNQLLTEDIVGTGLVILAVLAAYFTRKKASKILLQTINGINSIFNKLGEFLAVHGSDVKVAYAILQQNSKKCYQQCEIDPRDTTYVDYLFQMRQGSILRDIGRFFRGEVSEERMNCLRKCYLYTLREIVKLTAHSYFTCLKNTGDFSKLPLEKDLTSFQKIVLNSSLSESCDSISAALQEAISGYMKVLDLIYSETPIEIRKQKTELMSDIYNIQKQFTPQDQRPKFQITNYPKSNVPQNQSRDTTQRRN